MGKERSFHLLRVDHVFERLAPASTKSEMTDGDNEMFSGTSGQ